jgi:hypothetical protein
MNISNLRTFQAAKAWAMRKIDQVALKFANCEMSARPSGLICNSTADIERIRYDQMGALCMKYACRSCRDKMLKGLGHGWIRA